MRLARFDEGKNGHKHGERRERAVTQNRHDGERLGSAEAAAIDVHVEKISARNGSQESQHDQRHQSGPDAQPPSDQQQQPENNFRERQRVGHKIGSSRGKDLVGLHLLGKSRKVRGNGESEDEHGPQVGVGKKYLGDTGVNKNSAKEQAADEDHCASEVEWAGLQHLKFSVVSSQFLVWSLSQFLSLLIVATKLPLPDIVCIRRTVLIFARAAAPEIASWSRRS